MSTEDEIEKLEWRVTALEESLRAVGEVTSGVFVALAEMWGEMAKMGAGRESIATLEKILDIAGAQAKLSRALKIGRGEDVP